MTYANTRGHLFDELDIVDAILEGAKYAPESEDATTEELDVDAELDFAIEPERLSIRLPSDVHSEVDQRIERIEDGIEDTDEAVELRVNTLRDRFELSRNHFTVFMLALAPDLDASYEMVYQQLQEDSGAKRPTIGFIASLFGADSEQRAAATALVGPGSPLRRYGLVEVSEPAGTSTSHRHRMLGVDPRLISYLEGHDDVDPALAEIASVERPDTSLEDLHLDETTAERLAELAETSDGGRRIHYFFGADGSQKERAVEVLAEDRLLRVDLDALLAVDGLERFRREAILQDCPIHLTKATEATDGPGSVDLPEESGDRRDRPSVNRVIDTLSVIQQDIFVTGTAQWTPTPGAREDRYSLLEFPKPGYSLRKELWESYRSVLADEVDTDVLANTFELTQGQIEGAIATARALTDGDGTVAVDERGDRASHDTGDDSAHDSGETDESDETEERNRADENDETEESDEIDESDGADDAADDSAENEEGSDELSWEAIVQGCRAQSAKGLERLADQIEPDAEWDDIVLPDATERQLRHVAAHIKHRGTVFDQWGFDDRFSRGKGVVALFAGPSGTGKTMAAEIIAADTGMTLYKIDLSSVVSKYIGETEENLERIFDAAKDSNAILLFDEADAVFGQRAGVSDATDRYANVEVNYLLQRIETYDGVVLLTSNYESHIDDAFMRRIHQTVSFRRPDEDVREQIWRIMFPDETPLGDLDYEFLGDLDLTGGNIRNVAQTAAVLAADGAGTVEMEDVIKAIRFEYEKLDKLIEPDDFGEYKHHLGEIVDEPPTSGDVQPPQRTNRQPSTPESGGDSPEEVIEEFFTYLSNGDQSGVDALYHSKAIAERFTRKDLKIHERGELAIESDFARILETHNRVVVQFTQRLNGQRMDIEYELRMENGNWRIYDLGKAGQRSPFKRR